MLPNDPEPSEYRASPFSEKIRPARQLPARDPIKTKYPAPAETILLFKCHGIRMQLVVMLCTKATQRDYARIAIHLTVAYRVVGIIGRLSHNMHTAVS